MRSIKGRVLLYCQIILMFIIIFIPLSINFSLPWFIFGFFLLILSIKVFVLAKRDLREAFYPFPQPKENAPFITNGIYARVRHPMYSSFLLGAAGFCSIKQSLVTYITTILLYLILIMKYRLEDKLLKNIWDQAKDYQARTPAFIPRWY
ncbi:MAG: methyltransferase family protein [Actinomycetales bacterium]